MISKPDKDTTKKENSPISLMKNTDAKFLKKKNEQTKSNNTLKQSYTTIKCDLSQGYKNSSTLENQYGMPH